MQLRSILIAIVVIAMTGSVAFATDVTFQVYMGWQEEIGGFDAESGDMVVVRGGFNEWSGNDHALALDEDAENSLYTGTFDLSMGDSGTTYEYKFVIVPGEGDDGWENVDNRTVNVGADAVVIDPVWFNNIEPAVTHEVTFQVYMSFQVDLGNFDPEGGDVLVVRGDFNGWSQESSVLEMVGDGGDSLLYAGTFDVPEGSNDYKFGVVPPDSGAGVENEAFDGNRNVEVGEDDMVLDPVWFSNLPPAEILDIEVLLQVDMSVAVEGGVFDPNSDAVLVRGGHESFGNWGGFNTLTRVGATDIYAAWFEFENMAVGSSIPYKFVIDDDNDQDDPVTWEELPEGGNRSFSPTGDEMDEDENGYYEVYQDVVYWANNPGNVSQDVTVTFILDTHPAFAKFEDVGIAGVDSIQGFWIAGLGDIVDWNWGGLPDEARLMDDGEMPDEMADDMIYTVNITFPEGTPKSQTYKYGINMLDNEAGFGENHVIMLDDEDTTMVVIDIFGSNGDDYDDYMSVELIDNSYVPMELNLEQNYPNPFNPVTSIGFSIPAMSEVSLSIFDLSGRQIHSYSPGVLQAGHYEITIDASSFATGTYFYRIEAGNFAQTKKMTLIK